MVFWPPALRPSACSFLTSTTSARIVCHRQHTISPSDRQWWQTSCMANNAAIFGLAFCVSDGGMLLIIGSSHPNCLKRWNVSDNSIINP